MDATFLEQLLYEDESATLDFKQEQYKFAKASDDDKSELLKDILGFANGWRRSDAYILIGVKEVTGGRSNVVGITDHLTDHSLQQFVNNLTNRPVRFGYEACPIDGTQIGVIRIEQQDRPIYLKKDYGKLKRGEVYVRRGSSTDPTKPATPEEIAQMGKVATTLSTQAELSIEFAHPEREDGLGPRIPWSAEWCEFPDAKDIPTLTKRGRSSGSFGIAAIQMAMGMEVLNEIFYHETANYEFVKRLFRPVRLVVSNTGKVAANDVRVEIIVRKGEGFGLSDECEIPERPEKRKSRLDVVSKGLKNIRPAIRRAGAVFIEASDDRFKLEMDCGNLQPGRKVWSDEFFIGVAETGEVSLEGHFFAENLSEPKAFTLTIDADITKTSMTVDELIDLAEAGDHDDDDDTDDED